MFENNKTHIMGILNVTPDSFSDGGKFVDKQSAIKQVKQMLDDGATIIDVGGESTRPGAEDVSEQDEIARVIPVIKAIREFSNCFISIDTSKPVVMKQAIEAGASMINDVRALQENNAIETAVQLKVPVCLMHMQGQPRSMQHKPSYTDVVLEVTGFLQQRVAACLQAGIKKNNIVIDPGFGFGKTFEHNISLFKAINRLNDLGYPVLIGVSKKTMIGHILNEDNVDKRKIASVVMAALAAQQGAKVLRVHDVKATADALAVISSLE